MGDVGADGLKAAIPEGGRMAKTDAINEEVYLRDRVDDQIAWYDSRSHGNKQAFLTLRVVEVVTAACIPLLSGYLTRLSALQFVVGVLGPVVAIIAGLLGLFQFQENWVNYRSTAEALKHEKFLYLARVEPYDAGEPFPRFVQRFEEMISKEQASWVPVQKSQASQPQP